MHSPDSTAHPYVCHAQSENNTKNGNTVSDTTSEQNVSYYDALADSYDLFFDDYARSMHREAEWLDRTLTSIGAREILDASCGAGRQAIPLRERGYDVVAADPSHAMLQQAQRAAREHHVSIPMVRSGFGDLTRFVGAEFDAVIAFGNGLSHEGSRENVTRALVSMARCCRPGGVCLIGVKDFDTIRLQRPRLHPHGIHDTASGRKLLFEIWEYNDPVLECTAVLLHEDKRGNVWTGRGKTTNELMLTEATLRELACTAGFLSVRRLNHPAEAAFALQVAT
jgi:ubiquinone/menaquinone biosynthesis C-methylase UbiE